jgi:hypothetical protein
MAVTPNEPTFRAYSVIKREGEKDFWLNIGAAFSHRDGGGFTLALQALPIDGRVVLRHPNDPES